MSERGPEGWPYKGSGWPRWLQNVLVNVGREPWGVRGPRPPPRWRMAGRALVAEIDRLTATHTSLIGPFMETLVIKNISRPNGACSTGGLQRVGVRSCRAPFFGTVFKTSFYHGIFFR